MKMVRHITNFVKNSTEFIKHSLEIEKEKPKKKRKYGAKRVRRDKMPTASDK